MLIALLVWLVIVIVAYWLITIVSPRLPGPLPTILTIVLVLVAALYLIQILTGRQYLPL
jgi:hypothetical protein